MNSRWLAACGLNCETCEIRLAPHDPVAAESVLNWFKSQGWLTQDEGISEVIERKMYCTGCHGSRETHWSSDCWILVCCVDEHALNNCSECKDFPCGRLVEWSQGDASYHKALATLKAIHEAG